MKNLLFISLALFTTAFISACATSTGPTMTPLEIQSMQTREFEADRKTVFASTMSVFQDLGYTIETADLETGLIRAQGAADSNAATKFWLGVTSVSQTAASAFVETIGDSTKVRLNFVSKVETSQRWGQTDKQDTPILDASVYQNAFERIENAVFIRNAD